MRIRSFSGPYFPAFGLNTEIYEVNLHIQFECRKIRTRKTPTRDTFHAGYGVNFTILTNDSKNVFITKQFAPKT